MKTILFVIFNTEVGGIYSSLLSILKFLSGTNRYQIHLMSLNGLHDEAVKEYSNVSWIKTPGLIVSCFSNGREIKNRNIFYKGLYLFTRLLCKVIGWDRLSRSVTGLVKLKNPYDYAVSFANDLYSGEGECIETGCNDFVRNSVQAKKKIGWIHELPNTSGYTEPIIRKVYEGFDTVVNCSESVKGVFDAVAGKQNFVSCYVNNILDEKKIRTKSKETIKWDGSKKHIVTIARIDNEAKRLDRIPEIFEHLQQQKKEDVIWHIIGDGKDFNRLQKIICEKGMEQSIILEGKKENPYPYLAKADVYVQTSDFESMPMVVLEAEVLGIPVVSTDYPSAKEMIPENCGIVCPKDISKLTEAIQYIFNHPKKYSNVSFEQKGEKQLLSLFA